MRQVLAAGALLVGALVAVTGCDNNGCVSTALSVRPVHPATSRTPVTLGATLTSDGNPVPGFRLSFFLTFTGPTQLVGKSGQTGDLIGYATTGADGTATRALPAGWGATALPGEQAVGYQVTLTTANKINGKYYCDAKASTSFH